LVALAGSIELVELPTQVFGKAWNFWLARGTIIEEEQGKNGQYS
jgi:hypothetical protein